MYALPGFLEGGEGVHPPQKGVLILGSHEPQVPMRVCMYVCMYVCICMYELVAMNLRYLCVYVCMYVCICMYEGSHEPQVPMRVCMYVCVYMYV